MRLQGKVAVITGAGSGTGRVASCLFAREGARVVVNDIDDLAGNGTVDLVRASEGEAVFFKADVCIASQVSSLLEFAIATYGRLDIMYNNAGLSWAGRDVEVADLEEPVWDKVIDVNLKGVYLVSKYAIPKMISGGGGSIINTSSIAGILGGKGGHAYHAAKGGVVALTRAVAVSYAMHRIRANAMCPAMIDTPLLAPFLTEPDARRQREERIPIGRLGTPEDVARMALYLASDESSFVTGAVFCIDGGLSAKW